MTALTEILFALLAVGLAFAARYVGRGRKRTPPEPVDRQARQSWMMPPLELLERPAWSRTRTIGMYTLPGYLAVAALMLAVKVIEVGVGH